MNELVSMAETEFIYRIVSTSTAKGVSLHRERDWLTGLSFQDHEPYIGRYLKYNVSKLKSNLYVVEFDGNKPQTQLPFWGNQPFIEPYTSEQEIFPHGHVTVYHSSKAHWDTWYLADESVSGSDEISGYARAFFDLREI